MKKLVYLCYGVFVLSFALQLWYAMSDVLTFTTIQKIAIVALQVIMLLLGSFINIRILSKQDKKRDMKIAQVVIFLIFIGNLIYLLFFDKDFGRSNHEIAYTLSEYFQANVNLVPMRTIKLYLDGYRSDILTWGTMMINIIGNIIVFMPFAYFLPLFFKVQRSTVVFMFTMLFIIIGVEIAQVLMQSGSGDIDDLILNMVGVMFIYILCKLPFLHNRIYGIRKYE